MTLTTRHSTAVDFRDHDPSFVDVLGGAPRLERIADADAHEGPVYAPDEDALYFTSVRTDVVALERLDLAQRSVSVVLADSNMANGMTLDRSGGLLICEQGSHARPARISRLDRATRELTTVVDAFDGLPLSSPNDVVVRSDGTVWFTDPSYGYLQGFRPPPALADAVYRYDPKLDRLVVAAKGFDKPNGLAFSPDERLLYVADNGQPHSLLAFDVAAGGLLENRRVLAIGSPGHPDGLKVDTAGRIYVSASGGVDVYDPHGLLIGEIQLPGTVNFTFGGAERTTLFVTTDNAIWAAALGAKGV